LADVCISELQGFWVDLRPHWQIPGGKVLIVVDALIRDTIFDLGQQDTTLLRYTEAVVAGATLNQIDQIMLSI
jgi:hypothetical protein